MAMATQQLTRAEWVEYKDSSVLNAIYAALTWKTPPGNVEIRQPKEKIDKLTLELHNKYLLAWVHKVHTQGPVAANKYVADMHKVRDDAQKFLSDTYREAHAINQQVVGETAAAIKDLAKIRLGASIGVAVAGAAGAIVLAPAGALMVTGVSLGYSSACAVAKTWEQGGSVKAVAIEVGKTAGTETADRATGRVVAGAVAAQEKAAQVIRSAEGEIRKYATQLLQEGLKKSRAAKATNIVNRATAQVAQQQKVLQQASRVAKVGGAVKIALPLVFAAVDIWGAWTDYDEMLRAL
jgi:vacuolar-type H+-ATPase subunit H